MAILYVPSDFFTITTGELNGDVVLYDPLFQYSIYFLFKMSLQLMWTKESRRISWLIVQPDNLENTSVYIFNRVLTLAFPLVESK